MNKKLKNSPFTLSHSKPTLYNWKKNQLQNITCPIVPHRMTTLKDMF